MRGGPGRGIRKGEQFKAQVAIPSESGPTFLPSAGIQYRRPYATRHTFALWHLVAGTHPEALVALMGHGSKQMVYEVYWKYSPGMAEQADQIRAYLGLAPGQK